MQGLQSMVTICEEHAIEYDLVFSTHVDPLQSKTQCLCFGDMNKNIASIILNKDPLPWMQEKGVKHVGTKLSSDGTMENDLKEKRAIYIQTCMNLNQVRESTSK